MTKLFGYRQELEKMTAFHHQDWNDCVTANTKKKKPSKLRFRLTGGGAGGGGGGGIIHSRLKYFRAIKSFSNKKILKWLCQFCYFAKLLQATLQQEFGFDPKALQDWTEVHLRSVCQDPNPSPRVVKVTYQVKTLELGPCDVNGFLDGQFSLWSKDVWSWEHLPHDLTGGWQFRHPVVMYEK